MLLASVACGSPPDPRRTDFRVERGNTAAQYDKTTGRLQLLEVDTNTDGQFDTWTYADGTRVERIEIDRDFDGVVDRWEYYRENVLEKVGTSSRGDGVVDEWAFSDPAGLLRLVESDTDRNGHVDKWERFVPSPASGLPVLQIVELDTRGGGVPTDRLTYRMDGTLDGVEKISPDAR